MADRPKQDYQPTPPQPAPAAPTHDAAEFGHRSIDAVAGMTRQNIETMLTVADGAVQGFEAIAAELAAFSRESVERAARAARAMTSATSPGEALQVQADYSRQQIEAAMTGMTKLSHTMLKTARESLARTTPRGGER